MALFWRSPRCPKGVFGPPLGSPCARPGAPRRGHRTVVICCLWGLSGALLGCSVGSRTLFFWPILLISLRWAYEVAPQELAWVGCSKPLCFTRFWARSGCGGLAWGRAWGALGPLLGPLGASRGPTETPKEHYRGGFGSSWETLATSGGLWGPLRAFGGLWGSPGTLKGFPRWSESFAVLLLCPNVM